MIKKLPLITYFSCLFCLNIFGQTVVTTSTPGSYTFTVPCDVTSLYVEAWGGGGAGGGDTSSSVGGAGGGAGGTYAASTITVTGGQVLNLTVGAGGVGDFNAGNNGDPSWFGSTTTLYAEGGAGGAMPTGGRAGGIASSASSIGTTVIAGTNGANGTSAIGAAGGNGGNGGTGGNQRTTGGNGNSGNAPGGGGGGAFVNTGANRNGGNGGSGQIRITYTSSLAAYCTQTFTTVEPITNVTFAGINNTTSNTVDGTPASEQFCSTAYVQQGLSYSISLKGNTDGNYTDYFRVYIDWDQNGTFGNNANEIYDLGTITNSTGIDAVTLTATITVPAIATLGNTKMRVIKNYNAYTGPCASNTYGQSESYLVNVTTPAPCTTPSAPSALNLSVSGTSIYGSFTAASPAPDGYLVMASTSATPPSPVSGTTYTIGQTVGAYTVIDTDGDTAFIASGLNATTTYYIYVFSMNTQCSGGPLYSASNINGSNTTTVAYCEPTSEEPQYVYIDDVSFMGTLNDVDNLNTGYSTGYQDWTGITNAIQAQGEGVNIYYYNYSYSGSAYAKAWVDWNQDGDFDDTGELIYDTGTTATTSATFGFVIPSATPPGDYRLRIRNNVSYDMPFTFWYDFDSCEDFLYTSEDYDGEAEDYLFTVIQNCSATITSLTDGERCDDGTVDLSVTGSIGTTQYHWYDSETGGTLLATTATGDWTTPALSTTTSYWVTADNGSCESLVRTEIIATINPISNVVFTPASLTVCGDSDIVSVSASGDTEIAYLIDEDFESGGLGVFTNQNANANGAPYDTITMWQNETSTYIPTNTYVWSPAISSGFGTNMFAMSTSDVNPPGNVYQYLLSPTVNATGFSNLTLTFDMYYSNFADYVDVQVYNGATWATLVTYNTSVGIGTSFASQSIDLSAYDNLASLQIRIRFRSSWGDGVAVDNIKLFGTRPIVPAFTWTSTPAIDAYTDASCTIPYTVGTPIQTVYIKPTFAQLELSSFNVAANVTLSNGCSVTQSITVTNNSKVWRGDLNSSSDWNDSTNWRPNGIPDATNCIVIPDTGFNPVLTYSGPPTPPQPGLGLNLTLKDNAFLEVESEKSLIITDWVHVEGNAILSLQNSASLVQVNNVANSGYIFVQRAPNSTYSPVGNLEYVYWSSPVSNFNVSQVSPGSTAGQIWQWNATVPGNGIGNHGDWYNATGTMGSAKGYAIRKLSGTPTTIANTLTPATVIPVSANTALFSGVPNNGDLTIPIYHGGYDAPGDPGYQGNSSAGTLAYNNDDNWNLLGNPYPSSISANEFVYANSNINGTVYLWQHSSTPSAISDPFYDDFVYNYDEANYIEHNYSGSLPPTNLDPDLYIASGQAFFVLMNHSATSGTTVSFNNGMRDQTFSNTDFYRQSSSSETSVSNDSNTIERHRIWLDLITPNNKANTALIGYIEGATNGFDRLYDGHEFESASASIYSLLGEEKLSIQGRSLPFDNQDVIPLGIQLPHNGIYKIAINLLDGLLSDQNQPIFLEDTYTNMVYNLKDNPYSFTSNGGTFNDRFFLRFTDNSLSMDEFTNTPDITIFTPNNDYIKIVSGKNTIEKITVHDLLGRTLINRMQVNSNAFEIHEVSKSDGAYIVKVTLSNGQSKTQKVVLKQ